MKVDLLEVSLMNFILGISKDIKWKVKVVLLDELHSCDIQGDQMEGESGLTLSTIDELRSLEIQVDQMECESGVPGSISDALHSWYIQEDQIEGESVCYSKYH